MASHVQNENTYNENADDLMGAPSFHQLTMQIAEPLPWVGPIAGYDFIVDDGYNEECNIPISV